ncbi:MAG TPA: MASE3 domain-containing protein [Anaeromyxobacteraceae bacterium]|nr:MASE3 domain-containing protein [Anaeromyxobacteraceae bacterium]
MQRPWPGRPYLALHLVAEVLVIVSAAATFAVQWYAAAARLNDARARFVGSGFLAVGLLETLHLLAFPGMPGLGWLESSTERGIVYWLAARLCTVGTLCGVVLVPPESRRRALRRGPLMAIALCAVGAVVLADVLWISRRPIFYVEGSGLTPLKKALELTVALAALGGALMHGRRRGEPGARDLAAVLALTLLSEICFMQYARAQDSFNLLGHVYLLLATYGAFHALFADAVIRPYDRLAESRAETERLRRVIEEELAVTIRRLQATQEQQQDLLRAVTHDLRTPLQVVTLHANHVARAGSGEQERRAGATISAAAAQMSGMMKELAEAVRLESGALRLSTAPLDLGALVRGTLDVARGALDTDRVRVDVPQDLPPVSADEPRLARVLQNVVGNALKYSPAPAPVTVSARACGGEVVMTVEDRGPGIPPEHVPRLFERFYRAAQRDAAGGLGLGLYISRLIVEAHGGRIWCESRVGEGTRLSVALPAAAGRIPATVEA